MKNAMRLISGAIGASIIAIVLVLVLAASDSPSTTPGPLVVSLKMVSTGQLAKNGLTFNQPGTAQTAISRASAVAIATARFPSAAEASGIREVVLANVTDASRTNPALGLTWVVDLTPPGGFPVSNGPEGNAPQVANWFLVFIDAQTGQIDFGEAGL